MDKPFKIGISGAHGTGKTTLIESLEQETIFTPFCFRKNITRDLKGFLNINENGNDLTQRYIINQHVANVHLYDRVIMDRTIIDGLIYTEVLNKMGQVSSEVVLYALNAYQRLIDEYDIIFYIRPEFELKDDGTRSINKDFYNEVLNRFEIVYREFGTLILISGTVEERVSQVKEHIINYGW